MTEKAALRRLFKGLRASIPAAERRQAGRQLTETLLDFDRLRRARVVAGFASVRSEIPTRELLSAMRDWGQVVLLPRVLKGATEMVMGTFGELESLKLDGFGIPSPDGPVHSDPIDVVLVPGLAFGRDGSRLGYGGGFYDRFLASPQCRAATVCGLGYQIQVVDTLPIEAHDLRLTHVATPDGVLYCRPGASLASGGG